MGHVERNTHEEGADARSQRRSMVVTSPTPVPELACETSSEPLERLPALHLKKQIIMAHKLEIRPNLVIGIQFIFTALEELPTGAVTLDG